MSNLTTSEDAAVWWSRLENRRGMPLPSLFSISGLLDLPSGQLTQGIVHRLQQLDRSERVCDPLPNVTLSDFAVLAVLALRHEDQLRSDRGSSGA